MGKAQLQAQSLNSRITGLILFWVSDFQDHCWDGHHSCIHIYPQQAIEIHPLQGDRDLWFVWFSVWLIIEGVLLDIMKCTCWLV